jgi:hypothetical protein
MNIIDRIDKLIESTGEYCHFFKAKDKNWYFFLGDENRPRAYGPFDSFEEADKYLSDNHANPGGYTVDKSGKHPAPPSPFKEVKTGYSSPWAVRRRMR